MPGTKLFSGALRSFLALWAAGHAGGPACPPRRPGSVLLARALGAQSREIWQQTTGLLSDQLLLIIY